MKKKIRIKSFGTKFLIAWYMALHALSGIGARSKKAKQDFFSTLLVALIRTPRAPYNVTRRSGFMFLGQIESFNPS